MRRIFPLLVLSLLVINAVIALPGHAEDSNGIGLTRSSAEIDPLQDLAGPPAFSFEPTLNRAAIDSAQLYAIIESAVSDYNIPGMAVSAVKHGRVVWSSTHGFADTGSGVGVTDSTSFMVASISKTCVGIAVMQLVEDGLLDLDMDVDNYLPFDVDNPHHPFAAITTRMLLTHVSSISVKNTTWLDMITVGVDSPVSLHWFLSEYLVSGGSLYAADNYTTALPGTAGEYSNVGYTLLGYLVEVISGQSLEEYCQENIFQPLGMTETSWLLAPLDVDNIAVPTAFQNNAFVPYGNYCFPTFPCGQWRTSLRQLTRYLQTFMNKGSIDGTRILEEATVEQMMEVQFPSIHVFPNYDWGLGWFRIPDGTGAYLWGHTGGLYGVSTFMFFDPVADYGFIGLSNGDAGDGHNVIIDALYLYARDLEVEVPVLVSGLRGERQHDGSARVSWSIAETTTGPHFHVWRESADGRRERISKAAIEAGLGGECSFVDLAAPRSRVSYWLQMLEDGTTDDTLEPGASSWVGSVTVAAAPLGSIVNLRGSYPNPFRGETALSFETGRTAAVKVEVYDLRGRRVKTLIDEQLPAGSYRPVWKGEDEDGRPVSVGTYIYRIQVGDRRLTQKVTRN